MNILSYRLPSSTPDPSRHSSCGWVAIIDDKEVGWCNMSFLPHNTLKFEDAFVDPDYRGKGIYRKLWDTRWEYVTKNFKGMKVIAYCKPITVGFYEEKGFEEVHKITLVEKTIT
tara:strand:+ start:33 stop:374 length:342 start_codon:yes stop_codon:yes gene_type:complete